MTILLIQFKNNDYTHSIRTALTTLYQDTDPSDLLEERIVDLHERGLLHGALVDLFSTQHLFQRALTRMLIAHFGIPHPEDQGATKAYLSTLEYVLECNIQDILNSSWQNNEWVWINLGTGETGTV